MKKGIRSRDGLSETQPKSRPSRPRHEWSPTSDALGPFTGVCFRRSTYHATVCVFCYMIVAVHSRRRGIPHREMERDPRQGHIRGGPIAVLERKHNSSQSRPSQCNPKAYHHTNPQGRRQEELSDARNFRVGTQTMHSLLATVCVRENAPAPEGLCGWCCVFWTGTHRVAA